MNAVFAILLFAAVTYGLLWGQMWIIYTLFAIGFVICLLTDPNLGLILGLALMAWFGYTIGFGEGKQDKP
jgi:hypothetical protein